MHVLYLLVLHLLVLHLLVLHLLVLHLLVLHLLVLHLLVLYLLVLQFTDILSKIWTYHKESNLRQTDAFAKELEDIIRNLSQVNVSNWNTCTCILPTYTLFSIDIEMNILMSGGHYIIVIRFP